MYESKKTGIIKIAPRYDISFKTIFPFSDLTRISKMQTQSNNQLGNAGYDKSMVIHRPCHKFRFSTWESFKAPFSKNNPILSQILKQNVGCVGPSFECLDIKPLGKILSCLENKLTKKNWQSMVNYHCFKYKEQHINECTERNINYTNKLDLIALFRAIGHEVLPKNLFGKDNRKTLKQILKNMNILLSTPGKASPVLIEHLCNKLDPSEINWIVKISQETKVRENLLAKTICWLAINVFWRVVTGFFYIMDTTFAKNELYFVPKKYIHSVVTKVIGQLSAMKHIKNISSKSKLQLILNQKNAPSVAKGRFLLKKQSATRLICMKKKLINIAMIQDIQNKGYLLSYIAKMFPGIVDVKGVEFHALWSRFVDQVKHRKSTKIYIIVTDIRDAYGSVSHSKLVSILNKLRNKLPRNVYIHDLQYTFPNRSKFRVFYRKIPSSDETLINVKLPKGAVIHNNPPESPINLDVNSTIKSVCQRTKLHTIQMSIGKKKTVYLLNHGLIQGDGLSVPLCNIYYGDMVRRHLNCFLSNPSDMSEEKEKHVNLFARGMDDFIFATTDETKAKQFIARMNQGFSDYNCEIQKTKTKDNIEEKKPRQGEKVPIVFCGAIIDPINLSCRPDFSAYVDKNIAYASTFNVHAFSDPFVFIMKKMLFLVGLKIQALYLDESYNGRHRVISNAFEIHYMSALRFHSLTDSLIFINGHNLQVDYILKIIRKCSLKIGRLYARLCVKHNMPSQTVSTLEMKYLFVLAFKLFLSKKGGTYGKGVLKCLNGELSRYKLKSCEELDNVALSVLNESSLSFIKSHAYQKI